MYHPQFMTKRVAYQGISGSFSSMAARTMFGNNLIPVQTTRFREIFEHVSGGSADIGVVPIENALAGSIHENYDLLSEFSCSIVGEYFCPVQLNLLGLSSGIPISSISRVFSHSKAIEQCSDFFEQNPTLSPIVFSDTAGAALHVKDLGDPTVAAVASNEAASEYGLAILQPAIQNHALNATRFFAIATNQLPIKEPSKCSLELTLPHKPASLYKLLGSFAELSINVTKIESRPIPGKPFEYTFHLDLESGGQQGEILRTAVVRARPLAGELRTLGFYSTVS